MLFSYTSGRRSHSCELAVYNGNNGGYLMPAAKKAKRPAAKKAKRKTRKTTRKPAAKRKATRKAPARKARKTTRAKKK